MPNTLSVAEARRIAIVSQGFGRRPLEPTERHLKQVAGQVHAFQIDSVNVLVRAHYVPAFARLGPYDMESLDALAYR
ncbi:MAG: winged helix-turn-helix domain-containing protein, partial [Chloroflexi bacterium]|nr:winged helix-turn-helix domain-containing protein [Chloroflexota bacterium]